MSQDNWYFNSFQNQIFKLESKIPKGKVKKCRIYIEVFEDDIELINELLEKRIDENDKVLLVCAISAYGMLNQLISKTGEKLTVDEIKKLRNNFGYRVIYLEITQKIFGKSEKFFDKLRLSNWFLKKVE